MAGGPQKEVSRVVVGNEQTRAAVAHEIGHGDAHAFAEHLWEPVLGCYVCERTITIVVKELHRLGTIHVGMAITGANRVGAGLPVAIVGNEKVEVAVVVVVDPRCGNGPIFFERRKVEAGFSRDVGKRAIAIVAIKLVAMDAGDEQILVAIVVVIAYGDTYTKSFSGETSLCGDIAESAVAIVAVETIPEFLSSFSERRKRGAINAEKIGPTVTVKIDDAEAARQRLDLVFAARSPIS